nr:MAG TPA: hypothetical protein [Caudoviricetes sp.]
MPTAPQSQQSPLHLKHDPNLIHSKKYQNKFL